MNAYKWVVDDATILVKSDTGFSIIWAGAEFGPAATLEELCEENLLEQCRSLLATPGIPCERLKCDVGPFGDSETILLEI